MRLCKSCANQTTEGVVQVVLKVWSSDPDYGAGCGYVIVEIVANLAKLTPRANRCPT